MKNILKFGMLAFALTLGTAACNSEKTADGNDTTLIDTINVDTIATDSALVDTTVEVATETTEIKN